MKPTKLFVLFLAIAQTIVVYSKEGLWMPYIADQLNYNDLKENGFQLNVDDIYSINHACLKDAIIMFGNGCTGEVVSKNGLIFTNHHCGIEYIQAHSTTTNNILRDGFWARNNQEELTNPGLKVKFLKGVVDYSKKVLAGVDKTISLSQQGAQIDSVIMQLEKSIEDTSSYLASIEEFYAGNKYFLFLYKEYADIRLVGAPPEAIGNFGGDTDNWIWPRHTCDFSVFRIYTSPSGEPAKYAIENIPMVPEKYFKISTKGVEPGDFTMILGYPGHTNEYLYSRYLKFLKEENYPIRIKIRGDALEIIDNARKKDDKTYINYASKQKEISNVYKKWKGAIYGLQRVGAVDKRKDYEHWLIENAGSKKSELEDLYQSFDDAYTGYEPYLTAVTFFEESIWNIEPFQLFGDIYSDMDQFLKNSINAQGLMKNLRKKSSSFFKYYSNDIDKQITLSNLNNMMAGLGGEYFPSGKIKLQDEVSLKKYIDQAYAKSIFTDSVRFNNAIVKFEKGNIKAFSTDPIVNLFYAFRDIYYNQLKGGYDYYQQQLKLLSQEYILLIQAIDTTRTIYPDANFTFRMTYGNVEGYSPSDGVDYLFQTHLDGLIEKTHTGIDDYRAPAKLIKMFEEKDFGQYADKTGNIPLCFTASNHTSGGNSGSPVLDAHGHLVGINFDRTWEGTMSDFYFDDKICRNIAVDIRYVLFIIDVYSGAGYLLDEMDIEE